MLVPVKKAVSVMSVYLSTDPCEEGQLQFVYRTVVNTRERDPTM